ncbi:MAG TPA: GMC family oxidoreductase, partial [Acidimicrobiia bacterium]|nr:GMC family oxidoreductase [Acidimicrobiia bacterium]
MNEKNIDYDFDVLVVGSGFGGSVTALRLTEKGYRVGVLEAGKRFGAKDFPKTNWNLRKFLYFPRLGLRGIQRITVLSDALVLSGAGVGGGSLVYANTLYQPLDAFYVDPQWAKITDWRSELALFYDQAARMLGVVTAPTTAPNDAVVKALGERLGVADTYRPTEVGVYFGQPGETVSDPFFGGAGPDRTGCIECGGCMVGCQHNAKNTLDRNYLFLAEQAGATVLPERQVTEVRPLSEGGYLVTSERPGPRRNKKVQQHRAEQVVFSAGVLGTVRLLAEMKEAGSLPHLSPRLGELTRTNSESILGAGTNRVTETDYSTGIAISSSIYPDEHTHIEGVRYPAGSNAMGLLSVPLVDGGGRVPRLVRFIGQTLRHPLRFLRSLSVRRWSERTVILLVMQSHDNSINLRWRRKRRGVKLRSEQGTGQPNPTYIPQASEAARQAADIMGGQPFGSLNESLRDTPVTAHILGGCVIGADAEHGVIDPYQRVYGHPGLHIADGSTISANLGVNPSLTITAQAERAMALWPNKGDP